MASGSGKAITANTGFLSSLFGGGNKETTVTPYERPEETGMVTLKPSQSALGCFGVALVITLVWCGFGGFFMYDTVTEFMAGKGSWFDALFITPFVLVGVAILVAFVYYFLALFNPKVVLTIEESVIPLGETAKLLWQIDGNSQVFQEVTITLVGTESATYRQGTSTVTDTKEFHNQVIFQTKDSQEMINGRINVDIPIDAMHSWEASNNKIYWEIAFHGDIPRWPDVENQFRVTIVPAIET